jgi:transposase-like protein
LREGYSVNQSNNSMETLSKATPRIMYKPEAKLQVVKAHKKGEAVSSISQRLKLNKSIIYSWIKKYKGGGKAALSRTKKAPGGAAVTVVDNIKASRTGAQTFSLAEDFGLDSPISNNSNIEVKFCPCCGTNVQAVRIALETYQTIPK